MADFKTVLESLAKGDMDIEVFSKQLSALLEKSPKYAKKMLSQLDDAYSQKQINDQIYAKLKGQINEHRRAHATETESGEGGGTDSTVFAQEDNVAAGQADGAGQATQVTTGNAANTDTSAFDVTGADASGLSEVDVDISAVGGADTSTPTSATGPTGTEWSDPSVSTQQDGAELGPGSIIKQRFKLLEVLGIGGMGKVYKGLDLLKEEARDRNPYCAIKLLNEDFKDHPEAFISLQRESSRQQKLAHPNIATIFDFDRIAGPGTPVYITMELMEGMELKDFIKKKVRKQGGLPFKEAFEIVKQLCAALSYAHKRRLVHSDLKPGNAFYCNDGTVKILDFGIARAVKNPVTGEAEKTLFDPGKLGALTPAYASLEMLEGEEPDTRDDTYALGCITYELLTGKHPFNKLPANKAKENGLIPADVKGLKRKQNRALKRCVAFHRKDRPENVDVFLEEFEARFIWYKNPFALAAILLVLAALGLTVPTLNYLHKQEINQIITDINTGDANIINNRLALISQFEKTDQLAIADEAKEAIHNYLKDKIAVLIDTANENYNFPKAEKILKEVAIYYPDSSFLAKQTELWSSNKKTQLSLLYGDFTEALQDAALLGDTKGILDTIRLRVDPQNALLTDPRPSNQYRVLADDAFLQNNFDQALALVESGLGIAPKDQPLHDSKTKITNKIAVIGLEEKIGSVQSQLVSLEDYNNIKADVIKLAQLEQDNALLLPLATGMKDNISQALSSTSTRADAEALANEYGELLSALQLGKELTQVKLAHLSGEELSKTVQEIVATDTTSIEQLMGTPKLDDAKWKSQMLANVQELDSLATDYRSILPDLDMVGIRESAAKLYVAKANETLQANRFDAATSLIDSGEQFAPSLSDIFSTRNAIADAKTAYEKKILVDGLKEGLKTQTEANQVVAAIETLDQLKAELAADDPYIATEATGLIAQSYERLAKGRFDAKDFTNALKLAEEGLKYNPGNAILQAARNEYVVEANIIDLNNLFKTESSFDVADVQRKIGEIAASPRFSGFRQSAIALLAERINTLKTSDENTAATLAQNAAIIFPGTVLEKLKDEIKPEPWPDAAVANTAVNAGKLTQAQGILEAAAADFSGHPDYVKLQTSINEKINQANEAFNLYATEKEAAGTDYAKLRNAKKQLTRAQAAWTDNPDFDAADDEISKLVADNSPASKKVIQKEVVDLGAVATATEPGAVKKEWKPLSSGRECERRLAGYGKRSKAVCFDLVNDGWRGPLMVVVPSGGDFQKNFAISRYEISIGDYAKYCALSGNCKPVTEKDRQSEPLRSISLQEAEAYAQWLTDRTGKTYRLPTTGEWVYAATAKGNKKMKKDYNCRVALGEKVIKGTGIVSVKTGVVNDWGLKNVIGNVQEWVKDGSGVKVRGGAFQDAHSKCAISLERTHNGNADETTGFRLILEEVG